MQYGMEESVLAFSDEIQETLCHVRRSRPPILPHMAAMKFKRFLATKKYSHFFNKISIKNSLYGVVLGDDGVVMGL